MRALDRPGFCSLMATPIFIDFYRFSQSIIKVDR
jgi:hypothetical protein